MSEPSESQSKIEVIEEKESKKLWITLPSKYAEILDILSDDTPNKIRSNRKAVLVEKMMDDYLEYHEKMLTDEGKWERIISIRRRAAEKLEKSIDEKITLIDTYLSTHPEAKNEFKNWEYLKRAKKSDIIDNIYNYIDQNVEEQTDSIRSLFKK